MSHPFSYCRLAVHALLTLRESKVDLSKDIEGAVRAALQGTAPEVVYTNDCYAVCADAALYNSIDTDAAIEEVDGFADCINADQCVFKEANVVVRMIYDVIVSRLAEFVSDTAYLMEGVPVGNGKYVNLETLRITEGQEGRFSEVDGVVRALGEPVVYGIYYETEEGGKVHTLILAADIEDEK